MISVTSARIGFYVIVFAVFLIPVQPELGIFLAIVGAWGLARVAAGRSPLTGASADDPETEAPEALPGL